MSFTAIGDLAQSFQLRRDTSRLNIELHRLTNELASGEKSDLVSALGGDLRALSGLERSLSSLEAYDVSTREAALAAEVGQSVLGRISADLSDLSASLLLVQGATDPQLVTSAGADARQKFSAAVAGLNSTVAGRTLFSGQAFDRAAFDDPEAILADLAVAVGPAATAADVTTAVDAFFAPGGAFETTSYLGSADPADPVALGDGSTATPMATATDPAIVAVLKDIATAALLDTGLLAGDPGERAALARGTGEVLLGSGQGLIARRAELGVEQERIEDARARIGAERSSYELARADLREADPAETAMHLRMIENQLHALYTVTGRLSNLNLANYLR